MAVLYLIHSIVSYRMLRVEASKERIPHNLQFFFDNGENANQTAETVRDGLYTVTANYVEFWFR